MTKILLDRLMKNQTNSSNDEVGFVVVANLFGENYSALEYYVKKSDMTESEKLYYTRYKERESLGYTIDF